MSQNAVRDDVVQLLYSLISPTEAKDTEIGIYNETIDFANANRIPLSWASEHFMEAYLAKARSVFANMYSDSYIKNVSLMERLKDAEFFPHEIASMSREHVFPERWREIRERQDRVLQSAYENTEVAMSDQITCGKCKKRKVSYYEKQTRGADEAGTIFYTCLVCGNKWKRN